MTWRMNRRQLAALVGRAKPAVTPTWVSPPVIAGSLFPGEVVTYSDGTIAAYPRADVVFQILVDGVPVGTLPYTVQFADIGKTVTVRAVGTNELGSDTIDSAGSVVLDGTPRMTISGQTILDEAGAPIVLRGFVAGHGELVRAGDEAASAALGANFRRIGMRWWTPDGTGFQTDAELDEAPGHIDPVYLERTLSQLTASRAAGLKNLVFLDSNCGQGVGGGTVCELGTGVEQDFFTPEGAAQRAMFIEAAAYLAGQAIGLIDFMEPLSEPSSVHSDQAGLWAFQEELMAAVLAVDPQMLFLIGAYPNYEAASIGNAFNPAWGVPGNPFYGKVAITPNFLTNLSTNPVNRVSRMAMAVAARNTWNCPVIIQQLGTRTDEDADDAHLDATLSLADNADGGPISYSVWEEFSVYPGSYGIWSLSNPNDANSARVYKPGRAAVLQAHFAGDPYWMTAPVITGTPLSGSTVSYTSGYAAGRPTPTLTARVRVNGVDKGDAATYVIQTADVGLPVVIRQTATNTAGAADFDSAPVVADVEAPSLADIAVYQVNATSWGNIPYADDAVWVEGGDTLHQRFDITIPSTAAPPGGYPVIIYWHPNGSTKFIAGGSVVDVQRQAALAAGFAFASVDFRHPVTNVDLGAPHTDCGLSIQGVRSLATALNLDVTNVFGMAKSRGSLCLWQSLQADMLNASAQTWAGRQSSLLKGIWTHAAQTTYNTEEFAELFIIAGAQRAAFLAAYPNDPRWGSALQSLLTAPSVPYLTIRHVDAYPTGQVNANEVNEHYSGFGSAMRDAYIANGHTAKISAQDLISDANAYAGMVPWFTDLVNGGAATLLSTKRIGGQIATPMDYIGDAIWQDLMRYARNFAMPAGSPFQYQEPNTLLRVASLTRTSNVVSVVLSEAPGNAQDLATGMRLVLTCPAAPGFDVDNVLITVTDATHFTYPSVGADASYTAVSIYDIPACAINAVQVGSNGQPVADFYSILSTVSGSATSKPDLNGVYNGVFPGTPPANISVAGAALSNYTAGGSTFTLTIDNLDTAFIAITFTGVPTNGTFVKPRIIRTDHDQTGATLLRPDYAQYKSRYGLMRFMDGGKTNNNAFVKSWANRPKVAQGLGMPLEDMVAMCNALQQDLWYCVPQWASDDYITQAMTYIRDNLDPALDVLVEKTNEPWNELTFFHPWWYLTEVRAALKAHFHGVGGESVITSVSRAGGVVTVNMNRVPPFADGATAVFKITQGSTGYDTPDAGAVMTVSGNSFSFTGGTASGAATVTQAVIIGEPTNQLYAYDNLTDFRLLWNRMHAKRTYDMAQVISPVFGGLNGRAKVLLMGWNTNFVQFGNLEDYGIKWVEAQYGSTKAWLWGIGGAPYCETNAGNTTPAQVVASAEASLAGMDGYFHRASYLAHRYAHEHIQYEGGTDLTALGNNNALIDSLYTAPEYRPLQKHIIERAIGFGVDRHCVYHTSVATPGAPGSQTWGLALSMAADGGAIGTATSTRLQGLDDALTEAMPPFIDPNQLPGTLYFQGGTGFKDDARDTFANNGMRALYAATSQIENLFFVPPANGGMNIDLTIWGGCVPGSGTNGVRVYLDDTLIGTLDLPTAASLASMPSGGSASATTITLPAVSAGKHRLKIKAPASQPDEVGVSRVVGV